MFDSEESVCDVKWNYKFMFGNDQRSYKQAVESMHNVDVVT